MSGYGEIKRSSLAHIGLDPDSSSQEADQLSGDGQAQAGSAVKLSFDVLKFPETFEDGILQFPGYANARILHVKENFFPVRAVKSHFHEAFIRKFDGIVNQVDQDLAQPEFIRDCP